MQKPLITLCLLFLSNINLYAESIWVLVSYDVSEDVSIYVDRESISTDGDVRYASTRGVFRIASGVTMTANSMKIFNCSRRESSLKSFLITDSNGNFTDASPKMTAWTYVPVSDLASSKEFDYVCQVKR